ncbi:hypothetical protein NQ314_016191 [Rhamnusium bicolor]|uniref:Uncharacterized protein n=1 Tax=Rhamnusium bicolor TaxID=1586634 RepID=A0AAV8WZ99_9CUCU|nr:hypothetical protein NQ314_016191 [Rhamnusium bicolor]
MSSPEQPGSTKMRCIGIKGKTVHSQVRKIIANIIAFMKMEAAGDGPLIPLKNVRQHELAATKISKKTYQRITREAKLIEQVSATRFSTPHKKRPKSSPKCDLGVSCLKSVRDMIHDFYIIEKRRPALREYLKELKKYKEGRPIIYTDETYLHSTYTALKGWTDSSSKSFTKPISKGHLLIILDAGSKSGFIHNGLLIFKSGLKSGDYHDEMNSTNFNEDNASYHNVELNTAPTTFTKKADMILWLQEKEIQYDPSMTKHELYAIIKQNKKHNKNLRN